MRHLLKQAVFLAPVPVIATVLVAALAISVSPDRAATARAIQHPAALTMHARDGRNSRSTNWSGYATTSGSGHYTDVKGSWKQPTATCSSGQTAYSAFWVGIDGDNSNTVEQTGTDADCSRGTPTYYAWYEMYPKFPVNLSKPVGPGDTMSAEVKYTGSGAFQLTISDSSRGWSFSTKQTLRKASRSSAEWIAEAPSSSGGVLPLANFGTVNFSNCTANGISIASSPNVDEIVMATTGGTVKAQPSSLSGGSAFGVTWKHS